MMEKISQIQTPLFQNQSIQKTKNENQVQGFGDIFKKALNEVNTLQKESDQLTNKLVTGEVNDISEVMIAAQKANLSLQLTIQVRNKAVEAYQEIMRMQV